MMICIVTWLLSSGSRVGNKGGGVAGDTEPGSGGGGLGDGGGGGCGGGIQGGRGGGGVGGVGGSAGGASGGSEGAGTISTTECTATGATASTITLALTRSALAAAPLLRAGATALTTELAAACEGRWRIRTRTRTLAGTISTSTALGSTPAVAAKARLMAS